MIIIRVCASPIAVRRPVGWQSPLDLREADVLVFLALDRCFDAFVRVAILVLTRVALQAVRYRHQPTQPYQHPARMLQQHTRFFSFNAFHNLYYISEL